MNKKIVKVVLCTLLLFSFTVVGVTFATNGKVEVLGATFEVTENVVSQDIGYDIKHTKDIAQSSKANNELYPQSINVLEIPSSEEVRIVNWTFSNPAGWTKNTVRRMAEDFEIKNPGWVVVAAINGDFFDINGTNKVLPYQTGGVCVSNSEVYRPFTNGQTIGFKNDASLDPLVAEEKFEVSNHVLSIYDENDNIIYEHDVKYFNETPIDNEVAIWFSHKDKDGNDVRITIPKDNTYYVNAPDRVLPMSTSNIYAKGMITNINEERLMYFGRFGIQTNNEEIKALLEVGTYIRVQQYVVGAYEDCTDITGGGVCLVRNGEAVDNTSNMDTHPRTCVGVKEDGTIVFTTIDGRQDNRDMHGMAYNEMSATMLHYGCKEAYNLDGGGSTTMIIRNQYGDFDVMNSPSDGTERNDSNSLLVVVPEMSLSVNKVTDTEVEIDYTAPSKDVIISNIQITINGQTKEVSKFPYIWDGLTPSTGYELSATYDLSYKSLNKTKEIIPIQFRTGVNKPYLERAYFYEYNDNIVLNYSIKNPANITCLASIVSGSYFNSINNTIGSLILNKTQVDPSEVVIMLGYNLNSSASEYTDEEIIIPKVILDFNNGFYDGVNKANDGLPILTLGNHTHTGWEYNGEIFQSIDEIEVKDGMVLKAAFTPLGGKVDTKKGCKKESSLILVETISMLGLALLVLRKKQ